MTQSVAITGMGILSSIGGSVAAFSASLRHANAGITKMVRQMEPSVSVDIAAEIQNFNFLETLNQYAHIPDAIFRKAKRLGQRAPFTIQVSILSALEAWQTADLFEKRPAPQKVGLIIAGQNTTQNYQYNLITKFRENPQYLSPRYCLEFLETNQVGILSELFTISGEGFVVGGASATGNVGLIKGYQSVRCGVCDLCLVVGIVADLSPMDIQGFYNMGAMGGKEFLNQPDKACRPFDTRHEGFIYGQAGACVVLESETHARKRGVPILAEIAGGSINLDANSSSNPNVNGEMHAMLSAIEQSGLSVSDIDYVNTHGSSSPLGDKTEAEAISSVFGNRASEVWLNATKGLTGHCLYSAGIVEAIATVVQMRDGFMHPNKNLQEPIHRGLRFCGSQAVEQRIDVAVSNSFGFGGINTSVVLKRTTENNMLSR